MKQKAYRGQKLKKSSYFLYNLIDNGCVVPYGGAFKTKKDAKITAKVQNTLPQPLGHIGFIIVKRNDDECARVMKKIVKEG